MKKSIFLFLLSACLLASCNNTSSPSSGTNDSTTTSESSTTTSEDSSSTSESSTTTSEDSSSTSEESSSSSIEEIKEFTDVSFASLTVTYDGNPHSVTVSNVPASATITYSSNVAGIKNTATDAGVYNVSAVIEDKNFITKELNTTLTINKAKFDNVTLKKIKNNSKTKLSAKELQRFNINFEECE